MDHVVDRDRCGTRSLRNVATLDAELHTFFDCADCIYKCMRGFVLALQNMKCDALGGLWSDSR